MTNGSFRTGYHSWLLGIGLGVVGCSSGTQSNPASGSSGAVPVAATTATAATSAAVSGPLALSASKAQRVTYTVDGAPKELLDFDAEKVRVSASCAKPDGTLDCDAMRLLRRTKSVQLTAAELSRGIPAGAVICTKLKIPSTTGHDAKGNEDGFCVFPDGSLASHGSVDTHVLADP